ncbi:nitroreductase family protein [Oscillospiraceae bacterium HV4-5-C5C]|nr:nitroreductase family protein [Oscillospiraceae bacterium HV4-5-C5C]
MDDFFTTRRSIRHFSQQIIAEAQLIACADAARLAPQSANLQPVRQVLINRPELCREIFPLLRFAAYLYPRYTPAPEQAPTAYLLLLNDLRLKPQGSDNDCAAQAVAFIYKAWQQGIGSCWMGAIDRPAILKLLKIDPACYQLHSLIALGYPAETPQAEDSPLAQQRYYLDQAGLLHVPKRPLRQVLSLNQAPAEILSEQD